MSSAILVLLSLCGCSFIEHAKPPPQRNFRTSAIVDTALLAVGASLLVGGLATTQRGSSDAASFKNVAVGLFLGGTGVALAVPYGASATYGWIRASE